MKNVFLAAGLAFFPFAGAWSSPASIPEPIIDVQTGGIEGFDLSPDGKRLVWLAFRDGEKRVFFRDLFGGPVTILPLVPGAERPRWAGDNRHIMVMSDPAGGERPHLQSFDADSPDHPPQDLTPFPSKKILLLDVNNPDGTALVGVNLESAADFSIYRVGPDGRKPQLVEPPAKGSASWMTDMKGRLYGRVRIARGQLHLEIKLPGQPNWHQIPVLGQLTNPGDVIGGASDPLPDGTSWLLMRNNADFATLQRIDLNTGAVVETVPADGADGELAIFDKDQRPLITQSIPDFPALRIYDADLRKLMGSLPIPQHSVLKSEAFDLSVNRLLLLFLTDFGEENLVYVDRQQGVARVLFHQASPIVLAQPPQTIPVTFPARDGLPLHGYLSWPAGRDPRSLPLVMLVHGGPWVRDFWGFDMNVVALGLQGYAVLRVNYRGSGGYGRQFESAGRNEWGGKMQDDLTDGACWAIRQGVADPARIAILGSSYGGYAVVDALERAPKLYVGGVEQNGPVDLPALIDELPEYSKEYRPIFELYIGSDRYRQWERSPLAHVDRIERPLLAFQGMNDPRVEVSQTKKLEKAMNSAGKALNVSYFADEGHGFNHEKNIPAYFQKMSQFLSEKFATPNDPENYKLYCGF